MGAEPLLHAAVVNNARWCDAVCRSHGYPGEFGGRLWISAGHALPFYPNAITLSPDVTAAEATNGQGPWGPWGPWGPSRPYSIKDSFARLDLAPYGLTPLFDATWIAMPTPAGRDEPSWDVVTNPGDLVRWEAAWGGSDDVIGLFPPALLDDPDCVILACRQDGIQVGGAIAFTAGRVTGISNVFKSEVADGPLWEGVVRAVAELRPGLPIVGYENGEDLAAAQRAGFTALGPLRVWARGSAVA